MSEQRSEQYSHLPVFENHQQIAILEQVPDIIWVFDLDTHSFWWGNSSALAFWGLDTVDELIAKDLSADTEGARKRTEQTFYKAADLYFDNTLAIHHTSPVAQYGNQNRFKNLSLL